VWFRYFSFIKCFNAIKVLLSYFLSIGSKKVFLWGKPFSLTVEPTNFCNLHCPECPTGNNTSTRTKGYLPVSDYTRMIDQLSPWLWYHMIYFQGEPFLHPDIFSILGYAHSKKIYTCTSTNGHFITAENARKIIESGLDKLIISVDGVTQEVYEQYRKGGNLGKVVSGIKTLAGEKRKYPSKTPQIVLQFLVFRFNEHQIKDIQSLGRSVGADRVEIKTAQIERVNDKQHLVPRDKKHSRYLIANEKVVQKNNLKNRCLRIWSTLVTTWDGKVIPCCFDKDASYGMGNIGKSNILDLWKSDKFQNFRNQLLRNRKSIKMCNNCTTGLHK
jgi:radical SAM protein with 4Fe4S-binding SPASM domain